MTLLRCQLLLNTNQIAQKLSDITHTFTFQYFRMQVEVQICSMVNISLSTLLLITKTNLTPTHTCTYFCFASNYWEKQQIVILLASFRLLSEKMFLCLKFPTLILPLMVILLSSPSHFGVIYALVVFQYFSSYFVVRSNIYDKEDNTHTICFRKAIMTIRKDFLLYSFRYLRFELAMGS